MKSSVSSAKKQNEQQQEAYSRVWKLRLGTPKVLVVKVRFFCVSGKLILGSKYEKCIKGSGWCPDPHIQSSEKPAKCPNGSRYVLLASCDNTVVFFGVSTEGTR